MRWEWYANRHRLFLKIAVWYMSAEGEISVSASKSAGESADWTKVSSWRCSLRIWRISGSLYLNRVSVAVDRRDSVTSCVASSQNWRVSAMAESSRAHVNVLMLPLLRRQRCFTTQAVPFFSSGNPPPPSGQSFRPLSDQEWEIRTGYYLFYPAGPS